MSIRLKYYRLDEIQAKALPCLVEPVGRKPYRVVPVAPILKHDCIGCVGERNPDRPDPANIRCNDLPDCEQAIYVRATPANKIKHFAWLLDQH